MENIRSRVAEAYLGEIDLRVRNIGSGADVRQQGAQFLPALAASSTRIGARK